MSKRSQPNVSLTEARPFAAMSRLNPMLKDNVEYQPLSVEQYEATYRQQQVRYLQKKTAKLGFQLALPEIELFPRKPMLGGRICYTP